MRGRRVIAFPTTLQPHRADNFHLSDDSRRELNRLAGITVGACGFRILIERVKTLSAMKKHRGNTSRAHDLGLSRSRMET